MSKGRVVIVGAVLSLAGGIAAATAGSDDWKSGQDVYQKVCGYCHDHGVGPAIRGRGAPPEYRAVVRKGRGAMPPFRTAEISDETLAKLMEHIK